MTEIINIPLSSAVERVRRHGDPVPHAALNPSLNIFRAPRRLSENADEKLSNPNSLLSNFHGTTVNCLIET